MKTRDGYEIKKGHIYYFVDEILGTFYVSKIRCGSFKKSRSGCNIGIRHRYYPNSTEMMIATNGQDFTSPETRVCLFKDHTKAQQYVIRKSRASIKKSIQRTDEFARMNLSRLSVDKNIDTTNSVVV